MRTSRRNLIKLGLWATASLATSFEGLAGVALAATQKNNQPPPAPEESYWLRRDMFEAHVNETFVARKPGQSGSTNLRLIRVQDCLSAQNAGTVNHPDCYVVVFRGPKTPKLAAGTYDIENAALGSFQMFVVPGQTTSQGIMYTATFNRVGTA